MDQRTPSQLRHEKLKQFKPHANSLHVDEVDEICRRALQVANASSLPVLEIIKLSIEAGELTAAVSAVCKASVEMQHKINKS